MPVDKTLVVRTVGDYVAPPHNAQTNRARPCMFAHTSNNGKAAQGTGGTLAARRVAVLCCVSAVLCGLAPISQNFRGALLHPGNFF